MMALDPHRPALPLHFHTRKAISRRWNEWRPGLMIALRASNRDDWEQRLSAAEVRHTETFMRLLGLGIRLDVIKRRNLDNPNVDEQLRQQVIDDHLKSKKQRKVKIYETKPHWRDYSHMPLLQVVD